MADLSDFKEDKLLVFKWWAIVQPKLFGIARSTVSKVMIAPEKKGKKNPY